MHNESLIACRDKKAFGGITDEQLKNIRETEPPTDASNDIQIEKLYTVQTGLENVQHVCLVTNLPHTDIGTTMSFTVFIDRKENGINNYRLQVSSNPEEYDAFNSLTNVLHEIYRLTDCIET